MAFYESIPGSIVAISISFLNLKPFSINRLDLGSCLEWQNFFLGGGGNFASNFLLFEMLTNRSLHRISEHNKPVTCKTLFKVFTF